MVKNTKPRMVLCVAVFLTVVFAICLPGDYAIAEGGDTACTFSYSVDAEHTIETHSGVYTEDIGVSRMNVVCNDNDGFSIYAVGYSNDEYGNNKMIADINNTLKPEYDIATGTDVFGETSNWAMKITALEGTYTPTIENGFDNYSAVPNTYSKIASFSSSTDDTVGASIQSTYAMFASTTQPAGSYTGKVKYTLVHPATERPPQPIACEANKVCYDANTNMAVGTMGKQSATANSSKVLLASNYSRAGYGFAGWNTEYDYSGTTYGPNETIVTPADMSEGLPLYAVWVKSTGNLQDWEGCYNLNVGDVTALTDLRDNQVYAVAKLADGKCWMIENLRLEAGDTTDVGDAALAQGYGASATYGNFVGLAAAENANFNDTEPPLANSLYSSTVDGNKIVIGENDYAYERMPRYYDANTQSRPSGPTSNAGGMYGYGNLYTWSAAIANTIYYAGPDSTDADGRTSETVNTSLCPSGWKLPRGGAKDKIELGTNDWYNLALAVIGAAPNNYNTSSSTPYWQDTNNTEGSDASKAMRAYPNNLVNAGYFLDSSLNSSGTVGYYWASTAHNSINAYRLSLQSSSVGAGVSADDKYLGHAVRCMTPSVQNSDVTVTFDSGVSSVTFYNASLGSVTTTTSGESVALAKGVSYTLSATYSSDERGFDNWATTNGVLGDATVENTTYIISDDTSLTLTSKTVCPSGKICYNKNVDSGVEGTMGRQSANANADVMLYASNYSRSGYGFAGWNTEPDYSGTFYGPQESITTPADMSHGLILYAVWVASAGSIQTDAASVCSSLTTAPTDGTANLASVSALTDQRDGETYAIAKLADGKCWMIENLRLDNNNSDNATGALAQGYGTSATYGNFSGLADPEAPWASESVDANSLYSIDGSDGTINIGDDSNPSRRFPRYNSQNTASRDSNTTTNQNIYSYGNYYTWAAAIADLSPHNTNNQTVAGTSLCPTGWHLPTGGAAYASGSTTGVNVTGDASTYRDFYNLSYKIMDEVKTAYEDTADSNGAYYSDSTTNLAGDTATKAFRKYPNNFILSGYVYNGSINNRNSYGLYWSSTARNADYAYRLYLNTNTVYPSTAGGNKFYGRSVRCVSDYASIEGYDYMQDFANLTFSEMDELKASMVENKQYIMKDSRDEKVYYVSKLADGNIWMTQNLDFDIGSNTLTHNSTTLYHDDTDLGYGTSTNQSWTPSSATYVYGDSAWGGSAASRDDPQSYDPGEKTWNGVVDDTYSTNLDNMLQGSDKHYSLGNYYNWGAAVASNDNSVYAVEGEDADQSICPAGWRLPKGGLDSSSGSFEDLVNQQGLTPGVSGNVYQSPVYFVYGGSWRGELTYIGANGSYWSSMVYDDKNAHSFYFSSGSKIEPFGYADRSAGNLVRCVARTPEPISINDLTYMQDFATLSSDEKTEVLGSMTEGEQYQLTDSRDNKVYYISKLADGNIWMTQNLDFDIGSATLTHNSATLYHDDTDLGYGTSSIQSWTPDKATYATGTTTWALDSAGYDIQQSYDPGDKIWNGVVDSSYNTTIDNMVQGTDRHYHLGNYYNWGAAVAMNDTSSYTTSGVDVDQSICPAGWRLPKGGSDTSPGSFNYLVNHYNYDDSNYTMSNPHIWEAPLYFTFGSGWIGSFDSIAVEGYMWSSVVDDGQNAFGLGSSISNVLPDSHGARDFGISVRCVAR